MSKKKIKQKSSSKSSSSSNSWWIGASVVLVVALWYSSSENSAKQKGYTAEIDESLANVGKPGSAADGIIKVKVGASSVQANIVSENTQ